MIKPSRPLELEGITLLARERPDILCIIARENFLPPTQLALVVKALGENVEDKDWLLGELTPLLDHYCEAVVAGVLKAAGIQLINGPA